MMSRLSLLDKLKILGDVVSSSSIFVVAVVIMVSLGIILIATSIKAKKLNRVIYIAIYGSIIIVSLIFYREELFNMFDYMMNNFFIAIYFPNLAIYFAAIIATNIILCISIFNKKIPKLIKTVNIVIFCIIHYLLFLTINIVIKSKLDIFSQVSIYQNKNALALIELSSTVFITWILFLIIYKIIRFYQQKKEIEDDEKNENNPQQIIIKEPISEPIIKKEIIYKRRLPDNITKTEMPSVIRGTIKKVIRNKTKEELLDNIDIVQNTKQEEKSYLINIPNYITEEDKQFLDTMLESTINEEKEEIKERPNKQSKIKVIDEPVIAIKQARLKNAITPQKTATDVFDNLLTLEDYKRVLMLLKRYKEKEQKQAKSEQRNENKKISVHDFQELIGKK